MQTTARTRPPKHSGRREEPRGGKSYRLNGVPQSPGRLLRLDGKPPLTNNPKAVYNVVANNLIFQTFHNYIGLH